MRVLGFSASIGNELLNLLGAEKAKVAVLQQEVRDLKMAMTRQDETWAEIVSNFNTALKTTSQSVSQMLSLERSIDRKVSDLSNEVLLL